MTTNLRRLLSPLALSCAALAALACVAAPAAAQTGKPDELKPPPPIPNLGKPAVPTLRPGPLPPAGPLKGAPAPAARRADEDAPAPGGGPTPARTERRPPPGGAPAADTGGGSVPAWRASEDRPRNENPTLSKDFVRNCERLRPGTKVHLDIYDEELESVVKLIACMTGKNIILGRSIKGKKITIYSPSMVTSDEAYRAFLSALEANGYTISRSGAFLKIIEIKDAIKSPDPLRTSGSLPPNEDRMVTQILPLKHIDAGEISEVLKQLASPNATFIVYQSTNSIIISETGSNLRKLIMLVRELDVPGGQEQLWVYQVVHASAAEIASKVLEIFQKEGGRAAGGRAGGAAPPRPAPGAKAPGASAATSTSVGESDQDVRVGKIIADERTNRLLVVATARSYRQIKDLIARLDVEIPGDGQVHIHQLNHAKAADLANVLGSLSQNQQQRRGAQAGRPAAQPARPPAGGKPAAGAAAAGGASAALFEGEVAVTADEATNTLVVTASLKDYLSLKRVIEVLDKPRRQVFLEAVVMEVSIRNRRQFGIAFHGAIPGAEIGGETAPIVFGHQPQGPRGLSSLSLANAATLQGLAVATAGPTVDVPGLPGGLPSFGAILHALATSDDANILSTPNILTTDNEEAEIVVGSNVPFVSGLVGGGAFPGIGQAGQAGLGGLGGFGGLFPSVSVQRQDVALTLKITPRINAENYVTLEVDQVVEEIESEDPVKGPTTSKRSVKSTVIVKDQQTIVIGGLQKNVQLHSANKVPFLGEIPVIGYFFRDSIKSRERRNLLLLLTPHVIEGPDDFRAIFKRKMEEHREFVARFHQEGDQLIVGVDYAKKHGAVEAMNKSLQAARQEEELIEQLRQQQQRPPLPQEVDGIPMDQGRGTEPMPLAPGSGGEGGVEVIPPTVEPRTDLPPPPEFEPVPVEPFDEEGL